MRRLNVDWSRKNTTDVRPTLKRFERWLTEQGYREACIETYVGVVNKFLRAAKSVNPTPEDAMTWHGDLAESKLARSTVNIWGAGLKAFYRSRGLELTLPYMKVSNKIPYFFTEEEVLAIFNAATNLKHYTMLSVMFYCMLRAGDLINLEDDDINMKTMTLRIRDGKFGKSAILPIPQTCIQILEEYLQVRPSIEIGGKHPVFFTDRMNKWNLRSLEDMFGTCKKRAGVTSRGIFMPGEVPTSMLALIGWLGIGFALFVTIFAIALDGAWKDLRYLWIVPLWVPYSLFIDAVMLWAIVLELVGTEAKWNKVERHGIGF